MRPVRSLRSQRGFIVLALPVRRTLVDAADFDGSSDYLSRGANLTGASSGKLASFAIWLAPDTTGTRVWFSVAISGTGSRFRLNQGGVSQNFACIGVNSGGTTILDIDSGANLLGTSGTYKCVMGSFDLTDTAKRHLYFGDTSVLAATTYTNDSIDFSTCNECAVGSSGSSLGTSLYNGGMADFRFWLGQRIDWSVEANRRKIIGADGKPAQWDLANISFGQPIVGLHLNKGETAANFATNRGTGGGFTVAGALTTRAASPSD